MGTRILRAASAFAVTAMLDCSVPSDGRGVPARPAPARRTTMPLEKVRYWAYQIQDLGKPGRIDALAQQQYDMLVLEPTRTDWSHPSAKAFDTRGMVERLKASSASDAAHTKLVLAYVDVGQAESWRWYWTWAAQPPPFVVGADPDGWSDCWVVAYWSPEWRRILLGASSDRELMASAPWASILDEVIADGFDGIYLDWVEAYDDERVIARARSEGRDAAQEMIRLIGDIRSQARERVPGFVVVQQNAAPLLVGHPELLDVIDAIAQEGTWYSGEADRAWDHPRGHDIPQTGSLTSETLQALDRFRTDGKSVFTVDYTVANADAVHTHARERGYVPYCSRSALSRLTTTPPPGLPQ
ncbi:MAG TPA: endo alpha-1,4 polygalactosaminidase [Labilithrix sp.]|nr:endo alpha-1,4 polygalactosaminidase [Labilithrix sp.]